MAITLEKIYKSTQNKYQLQLIAGKKSIKNLVEWVHMVEDSELISFLKGKELVIITGIGRIARNEMLDFCRHLFQHQASGFIINIGPYISEVPEEIIDFCEKNDFPLFTVPWEIKLVDVIRELCSMIFQSEQRNASISEAFKDAIFYPEQKSMYLPVLERHGYGADTDYCVIAVKVVTDQEELYFNFMKLLQSEIEKIINKMSDKFILFKYEGNIIIALVGFSGNSIKNIISELIHGSSQHNNYSFYIGVGPAKLKIKALSKYFRRIISLVRLGLKTNKRVVYYDKLDVHKLILTMEDSDMLHEFYREALSSLENYDRENNTGYYVFLKQYFETNGKIHRLSELNYIHRNTVHYQLKKIQEITGCNLADWNDQLKLSLAFYIKDIL